MSPLIDSAKPVTRAAVRRARGERDGPGAAVVAASLVRHLPAALALLPAAQRPAARREASQRQGAGDAGPSLVVAAHVSLRGEPGTGLLRQELRRLGHEVLLPVLRTDLDLDWVRDDGSRPRDPLRPEGELLGPGSVAGCDLVLVPALAVDATGTRLGQGGGSYDRALARLGDGDPARRAVAGPLVLALVHDEELLPARSLRREPHDVGVDGALTPSGLHLLGRAARLDQQQPSEAEPDGTGTAERS